MLGTNAVLVEKTHVEAGYCLTVGKNALQVAETWQIVLVRET
jgi:hypothetical protein